MPASLAISRTVVAWKPLRAKISAASLTRWSRRSEADPDAVPRLARGGAAVAPPFFRVVTFPLWGLRNRLFTEPPQYRQGQANKQLLARCSGEIPRTRPLRELWRHTPDRLRHRPAEAPAGQN